jgi:hypothetical protein
MQRGKRTIDHSEKGHGDAKEDRICQNGENSLRKLSLCGYEEDYVLTDEG